MNKALCYLLLAVNPICGFDFGIKFDVNEGTELKEVNEPESPVLGRRKKVQEVEEVFTPVEDPYIILDINDPHVQEVIKKVVSSSIHEAFKNKQLEKEIANKKKCCNSSTKLKIALITALSSTATAIITIALNNQ